MQLSPVAHDKQRLTSLVSSISVVDAAHVCLSHASSVVFTVVRSSAVQMQAVEMIMRCKCDEMMLVAFAVVCYG